MAGGPHGQTDAGLQGQERPDDTEALGKALRHRCAPARSRDDMVTVHLPDWVDDEWLKQFIAEHLVTVKTRRGFAQHDRLRARST